MTTNHLRAQAGGDPAQGPHPDVANPTPSPRAGEDFPDQPDERPAERPQDQPDLDAFAARLGTDRLGADGDESTENVAARDWRSPVASALGGLASGARTVGERLKGVSEKLVSGDADGEIDLDALRTRVAKVRTVMLTTVDERGTLSSRPLTVQHVAESGDVLFVVERAADWVSASVDAANVAFVDGSTTWISVAGRAVIDDDTRLLDDLWDPALDAFFPDGRASAVVLRVQSDRWEYWTAPNKLVQLVEIAKAKVGDDRPDLGDSGRVET
jgi:prepilin-type processing-associated H-X9-DG protein